MPMVLYTYMYMYMQYSLPLYMYIVEMKGIRAGTTVVTPASFDVGHLKKYASLLKKMKNEQIGFFQKVKQCI